ncbi:MAG TPA: polyprenol phosphomannose-dependent alpha 1,6 mannosyltransferase MptB [Acidimicrobiales bacterium]|nr:polyprenol phosphomannose-dependent alpha 1,6 mannosyltransferase MptB [Acidimicrobiales bacterium]
MGLAAAVAIVGVGSYQGLWFPATWWSSPFPVLGSSRLAHWQANAVYYGSLVVLGLAWVWLLRVVRARPRFPVWLVLAVFMLWSAPFVVGPSVSSEDVYAYAALGQLVERGFDPYQVGLNALGPAPVVQITPGFWRDNPTPYGPLYVRAAWLASVVSHDSVRGTVLTLRLFGLACLMLLALPFTSLARRAGTRPSVALTAVLCSPLVLVELVGAAHNEPLMLLLLAAGVAVGLAGIDGPLRVRPAPEAGEEEAPEKTGAADEAGVAEEAGASEERVTEEAAVAQGGGVSRVPRRRRLALVAAGVALCGAAATVKLPGLSGAALLGWLWAGPGSSLRRRAPGVIAAAALAAVTVVAISVASGLGLGWIGALNEPSRAYTLLAPFTAVGTVLQQVLIHLGLSGAWVLAFMRPAGMVLGVVVAGLVIMSAERLGATLALGLALLVLGFTTPAVWPWYLVWGVVFVAAVTMPPGLQVAIIAMNLALTPLGPGTLDVTNHPNVSALTMTLVIIASAVWILGRFLRSDGRAWSPARRPSSAGTGLSDEQAPVVAHDA